MYFTTRNIVDNFTKKSIIINTFLAYTMIRNANIWTSYEDYCKQKNQN